MKVLAVDDDAATRLTLKRILIAGGYEVVEAKNGEEALEAFRARPLEFDAVVTDWLMPRMDGPELVKRLRQELGNPYVVVLTSVSGATVKDYVAGFGADDYQPKPIERTSLLMSLHTGLARRAQPIPSVKVTHAPQAKVQTARMPPFIAVGMAASADGPPVLEQIFAEIRPGKPVVYFVVQHGPVWVLESLVERLQGLTRLDVRLAQHGEAIVRDRLYVAPNDYHMTVCPDTYRVLLNQNPPENFVRPAADPLFRSLADGFGRYAVGTILSGMGCDGLKGAAAIRGAGGTSLVQEPSTAMVPHMANAVINAGLADAVKPPQELIHKLNGLTSQRVKALHNATQTAPH